MDVLEEACLLNEGAFLTFIPLDARVNVGTKHSKGSERSISMRVELERGERVRLLPDKSLNKAAWSVFLTEGTSYNDEADKQQAIGYLSHNDANHALDSYYEEKCFVRAAVPTKMFESLLTALQSGRLPTDMWVRIRGLTYGWEPDGSGKEWDIEKCSHPSVLEITDQSIN